MVAVEFHAGEEALIQLTLRLTQVFRPPAFTLSLPSP